MTSVSGTIVEVRVFSRRGVDKDERALAIERSEIERLAKDRDDERAILERSFQARLKALLLNKKAVGGPKGMKSETKLTDEVLDSYTPGQCSQIIVANDKVMKDIEDRGAGISEDEVRAEMECLFPVALEQVKEGFKSDTV